MYTERQSEILLTSVNLIANKGIQGFTIRNLSANIGVTESAIYRHFKSKGSILCAILDTFKNELNRFMEEAVNSDIDSLKKLDFVYKHHIDEFLKNPAIVSVLFAEEIFKNDKDLIKKIKSILHLNQDNFKKIIEIGQQNNEIRSDVEADQLALVVLSTFRLTVKKWELSGYAYSLEEEGDTISHTIRTLLSKLT